MPYILAFDCGTTAVKASCVDIDTRCVVSAKSDCIVYQDESKWVEQDAVEMWEALCQSARMCLSVAGIEKSLVIGIVVSAPWKHIIPLNEEGIPLCRSLIWMDGRATEEAAYLNDKVGRYVGTGQEYWPRLLWLKNNRPDIWEKASHIVGINTYFKFRATGTYTTECSDNFIVTPNKELQEFYSEILDCAGISKEDLKKFPPSVPFTSCVGRVTSKASQELGVCEGVPVFAGFSDLTAITLGCGCVQTGETHVYLGTSGWLCELMESRIDDYAGLYFTLDEQHEGALFTIQTGARALEWIIERFYSHELETLGTKVFSLVNQEVSHVPAGSDGLIATHWLNGELRPFSKNAKAVFFNITEEHTRSHFAKAVMESLCYTIRMGLEKYYARNKCLPSRICAVGGGAQSEPWMQLLADILQIPVLVPENPRYTGTMGAFYCALVGLGKYPDYRACIDGCSSQADFGQVFHPNKSNFDVYDKQFALYKELYPSLKELYNKANGIY